jgi:Kef-type K+ transport system membrane component KefB
MEHIFNFSLPLKEPIIIFSFLLLIILFVPFILSKLRLPAIVGFIIAGIIFGPHGINIIDRNFAIVFLASIGILYIMFIAGLELDMNNLFSTISNSFVFGILTFLIPLAIGFPVCKYIFYYNDTTSLLVASIFSTQTLIAYPIVSRMGINKNKAVMITVGGTVLTDTLVLLLFSIITNWHLKQANSIFVIKLIVALSLVIFFILFIIPKISRWFFKTVEGERNAHFLYSMVILMISSILAKVAGVEPIIGAFLAGIALNRLIPRNSVLMNRIEFVGNSLFIPIFLIYVGMIIDISIFLKGQQVVIFSVIMSVVAIFGKWLAAYLTQTIMRLTNLQRKLIFGLSSSHAAATLAIILIGYNLELIDDNILNGTIILILVSCLFAAIVTENAAKKIAIEENTDLELNNLNSERILIPVSNPNTLPHLIDFASLIKKEHSVEPLIAFSVILDSESNSEIFDKKKVLEEAISKVITSENQIKFITRLDINVVSGISMAVKENGISDIVIGWIEKTKTFNKIFGSILDNLLKNTWQTIFLCNLKRQLNLTSRIIVFVPDNSVKENGFTKWINKIVRIGNILQRRIIFFCNIQSMNVIRQYFYLKQVNLHIGFVSFTNYSNLEIIKDEFSENDLLILINARIGSLSYQPIMEQLPDFVLKNFLKNNFVFVFPENNPNAIEEPFVAKEDLDIPEFSSRISRIFFKIISKLKKK